MINNNLKDINYFLIKNKKNIISNCIKSCLNCFYACKWPLKNYWARGPITG